MPFVHRMIGGLTLCAFVVCPRFVLVLLLCFTASHFKTGNLHWDFINFVGFIGQHFATLYTFKHCNQKVNSCKWLYLEDTLCRILHVTYLAYIRLLGSNLSGKLSAYWEVYLGRSRLSVFQGRFLANLTSQDIPPPLPVNKPYWEHTKSEYFTST